MAEGSNRRTAPWAIFGIGLMVVVVVAIAVVAWRGRPALDPGEATVNLTAPEPAILPPGEPVPDPQPLPPPAPMPQPVR